jgi:hypothetical protein
MNGSTCCAGTGPVQKISGSASCPFVLLGIDVELLRLLHDRTLDRLPRRAVDAAQDDVHSIVTHEFLRLLGRDAVVGLAVLENQLERSAQQATCGVDVLYDHPGGVRASGPQWSQRACLVHDDADLDGDALRGLLPGVHGMLSSKDNVIDAVVESAAF